MLNDPDLGVKAVVALSLIAIFAFIGFAMYSGWANNRACEASTCPTGLTPKMEYAGCRCVVMPTTRE